MNQYTNPWAKDEIKILEENYSNLKYEKLLEKLPGRSIGSIKARARKQALRRTISENNNQYVNPWTKVQDAYLLKHYSDETFDEMKKILGRTENSIIFRAGLLGVKRKKYKSKWNKKEDGILTRYYPYEKEEELMKRLPNRTWNAIVGRANRHKLNRKNSPKSYENKWKLKESKSLFYMLGAILGDGYILNGKKSQYGVRFAVTDESFSIKVYNALQTIGLQPTKVKKIKKPQKNVYYTSAYSKEFGKWIKKISVSYLKRKFRNNQYFWSFFEGFYEAEGNLNKKDRIRIRIINSDFKLLNLMKNKLTDLRYHTSIYKNNKSTYVLSIGKKKEVLDILSNKIYPCITRKTI